MYDLEQLSMQYNPQVSKMKRIFVAKILVLIKSIPFSVLCSWKLIYSSPSSHPTNNQVNYCFKTCLSILELNGLDYFIFGVVFII